MKRQVKTMIVVAATLATLAGNITPAVACGGRGGGGYGFGGYARTSYRPSSYAPSYTSYQPRYSQPVYNQTQYGFNQSASVINQPVRQITRQSIPQQTLRQPVQQQQLAQPQRTVQQQPSQRQPVQQASARMQTRTTAPANQLTSAANNAARQTAATTASANAETSALKMLQSLGTKPAQTTTTTTTATSAAIPQFSPAPNANDQAHVGTWKVNLPNSQSVQLALQADGKFVWTAVNKGNRRSFDGQYRMDNNRLTLVRANDLQQMAGSWTGGNNQFTFKLDGANNGGLSFKRS